MTIWNRMAGWTLRVRRSAWRSNWAFVAASIVCALPAVMRAQNAPDGVLERRLAPVEFHPASSAASYFVDEGGLGRLCTARGAGYFVAPLRLDEGVVIQQITVWLEDSTKSALGMMSLIRRRVDKSEILAATPMSSGTRTVETLSTKTISAPVVNNRGANYLLQVVLSGPGVCLHGARVEYRAP